MRDIDFDALAAELPAGEDVTLTADEGTPPAPTDTPETGETDETEGAGDDAGAEDEADKPEQEDEDEPKRRRPSGSERARRQIEALRAEVEALRERSAPSAGGQDLGAAVEAEIGKAPKETDFPGDYLAYERALNRYELRSEIVSDRIKLEQKSASSRTEASERARISDLVEDHQERLQSLEKRLPGSTAKINAAIAAGRLNAPPALQALILESEKSGHIALHLSEHPDKLDALNRMSPVMAARELGRLEARLSIPKPRTATSAPAPVRPVKGAATPASPDRDLDAWLTKKYGG